MIMPPAVSCQSNAVNGQTATAVLQDASQNLSRQISQPLSQFGPSLSVPKPYEAEMQTSSGVIARTFRSPEVLNDERRLAEVVADALVVDFGHFRSTHKVIAKAAGASSKSAENWTAANTAPSLINFLRLLPHSPSLQSMVRKLMGMQADLDPDFQREFVRFMQMMSRTP